jgi:hypothetical protein
MRVFGFSERRVHHGIMVTSLNRHAISFLVTSDRRFRPNLISKMLETESIKTNAA